MKKQTVLCGLLINVDISQICSREHSDVLTAMETAARLYG